MFFVLCGLMVYKSACAPDADGLRIAPLAFGSACPHSDGEINAHILRAAFISYWTV